MEFYKQKSKPIGKLEDKFQFPTGWNSTLSKTPLVGISISFNSQRDGILLGFKLYFMNIPLVSIPNGMEFY